jgi:hypothetical protein
MTLRKVLCVSFVVAAHFSLLTPKLSADNPTKFESRVTPFLAKYCFDCHDDETQKGDVAFHELNDVLVKARLFLAAVTDRGRQLPNFLV